MINSVPEWNVGSQPSLVAGFCTVKESISSGMKLATKDQLKKASKPSRRDPREACEGRAYAYRRDVILKMTGRRAGPGASGAVRGSIRGFTHQSRRRVDHLIRNTNDLWKGFLTLTYPDEFPTNGREVKRHQQIFHKWLRRKKIAYVWILEFQKRGAPHFHYLLSGWLDKDEVARHWTNAVNPIFPSEREKMLKASTRIEAVKNPDQVGGYMGAYMSKLEQKVVPKEYKNVGRFWGASRTIFRVVLELGERKEVREPLNPKKLYRVKGLYADASRAMRIMRKWYARHRSTGAGGFSFKWKWRGQGFILKDGASVFASLLRQSVLIDSGRQPWQAWDGEKDPAKKFITPADRLHSMGQMTLDGNCEKIYPVYDY